MRRAAAKCAAAASAAFADAAASHDGEKEFREAAVERFDFKIVPDAVSLATVRCTRKA